MCDIYLEKSRGAGLYTLSTVARACGGAAMEGTACAISTTAQHLPRPKRFYRLTVWWPPPVTACGPMLWSKTEVRGLRQLEEPFCTACC